jgi:hypothetical protein
LKIPLSSSPQFEEYAQSWGGVYSVPETDYRGHVYTFERLLIEMWNKETKTIRTNSFSQRFCGHFGFIHDMQPNASAQVVGDVHFCAINLGLIAFNYYMSGEIFICRNITSGIGGRIRCPDKEDLLLCPSKDDLVAQGKRLAQLSHTVNTQRLLAAEYFRHVLLFFTFYHEYYHALWGHCLYLRSLQGLARLYENGPPFGGDWTADFLIYKDIEYMADLAATNTMFAFLCESHETNSAWSKYLTIFEQHRIAVLALTTICIFWHEINKRHGKDALHPNPSARLMNILKIYLEGFQAKYRRRYKIFQRLFAADLVNFMESCPGARRTLASVKEFLGDNTHKEFVMEMFKREYSEIKAYEFLPV